MNSRKYYRPDNSLWHEAWLDEKGYLHREDGPAVTWYYEDGVYIKYECWCKHSKYHRLDGPARILYNEDGSIYYEHWYIDGEELTEEQVHAIKRNLTINKLLSE